MDSIIRGLSRLSHQQWVEAQALPLIGQWSREYGAALVFWRLWEKLGLHELFGELYRTSPVEFPVEEALFLARQGPIQSGCRPGVLRHHQHLL